MPEASAPPASTAARLAERHALEPGALWLPREATGWGEFAGSFAMHPRRILTLHTAPGRTAGDARNFLADLQVAAAQLPQSGQGGLFLAGYLSYDFGRLLLDLPSRHRDRFRAPLAWAGIYDWVCRDDGLRVAAGAPGSRKEEAESLLRESTAAAAKAFRCDPFSSADRRDYDQAFAKLQSYIAAGDCYQANLSLERRAPTEGNPMQGWQRAIADGTPPYAAYLRTAESSLLSFSPEEFLTVRDGQVRTRPIKGTRPRHPERQRDRQLRDALGASEKDRAENLMIVDLLRNDLGRYCDTGSITVPRLFDVESFPAVHHLVSTVSGTLRRDVTALQLLAGCLPGGSITGAPKRRAMEIIDELETGPRHTYCGTQFLLTAAGNLASSILIRSVLIDQGMAVCRGGGGIVADSVREDEFHEAQDKIAGILARLQTA